MKLLKPSVRPTLGQISDIDLRLLRVFRAVVDCGGMSAAGLELNIGTSTISRHIKDLETRLGLVLCRRGRAGFALTAEGQIIYTQSSQLIAATDAFRCSIDEIHQHMGGQLQIAVFDKTASNPQAQIAKAIAMFAQHAPDVGLNLHVATLNGIERGVLDSQYQLGIIPAHRNSDTLTYSQLFNEKMLLYCGAGHALFDVDHSALDWNTVRDYAFAGLGFHSPNMQLSQRLNLTRSATGFDQESIATFILSGRYLGFLPDHYAKSFVADKKMQAVKPELFEYDCNFFAITRRSPQASRAAQAFLQCLLEAHTPH